MDAAEFLVALIEICGCPDMYCAEPIRSLSSLSGGEDRSRKCAVSILGRSIQPDDESTTPPASRPNFCDALMDGALYGPRDREITPSTGASRGAVQSRCGGNFAHWFRADLLNLSTGHRGANGAAVQGCGFCPKSSGPTLPIAEPERNEVAPAMRARPPILARGGVGLAVSKAEGEEMSKSSSPLLVRRKARR